MSDWAVDSLGALADSCGGIVRTGPFGSQLHRHEYETGHGTVGVVMPKDMIATRVDSTSMARVSASTAGRLEAHLFAPADIALARRGDIGRAAWIDEADGSLLCGTGSVRIHLPTGRLMPRYLHYFLQTHDARSWLQGQAVGATMPNLNAEIVRALPVRYPSRATQATICRMLDSIDDLIENNRRRIAVLEQMAQAIYREWFVHFRYPGHENDELVDSPLGPIPSGWRAAPFSEAIEINPRVRVEKGSVVPFVTMGDVATNSMVIRPAGSRLAAGSGSKFGRLDTLFARITPCAENGKTGLVQFLGPDDVGIGSTELLVFRARLLSPYAVYLLARRDDLRRHAIASMTGASGRQRISNACFSAFTVTIPPQSLGDQFAEVVAPVFRLIEVLAIANVRLSNLRDLLLPKLVSGEIDVSTLDLDALLQEAPV